MGDTFVVADDFLRSLPNRELKALADDTVDLLDGVEDNLRGAIIDRLTEIRDEMQLRADARGDDGTAGVREPRRPLPGGSSAAAVADGPDP